MAAPPPAQSQPYYRPRLRDRSTGDLLVFGIATTICTVVILTVVTVIVIEIAHPKTDTSAAIRQVADIINTLIGLLAGFLAGRTDAAAANQKLAEYERRDADRQGP
jgi:hypothetical protein